jgi:hypothetical protein
MNAVIRRMIRRMTSRMSVQMTRSVFGIVTIEVMRAITGRIEPPVTTGIMRGVTRIMTAETMGRIY